MPLFAMICSCSMLFDSSKLGNLILFLPCRCNETKTSRMAGQRSSWSPGRRHHQSLWQRRPPLVRIAYTSCPPSNWPLWHPFPLNIWEEDEESKNRTSHYSRRQLILDWIH